MNLATGTLTFLGFLLLIVGVISRLLELSLLMPFINSYLGYFIAGNTCFLVALVVDKYQKS
jgi:UPF0716 family protein affecting phage T7 exclusion